MGKWIKNITAVLIIAFLVWYLSGHRDQLKVLMQMSLANIGLLYLATLAGTVNNSRVTHILIGLFSRDPGLWEMVILQNAGRLLNYVPMKFGTLFRANYLKRKYGLAYTHYVTVVTFMVLFTAFDAGLIGLSALLKGYGIKTYESRVLAVLFGCLLVSALFFIVVPLPKVSGDAFWRRIIRRFVSARQDISGNVSVMLLCSGHLMLTFILTSIRFWIIYRGLGHEIDAAGCLVLGAAGFAAAVMGLTPGALGVRELLLGGTSVMLGIPLEIGLTAAMFDRTIMLSWTFVVGGACTVWFWIKYPTDFRKAKEVVVSQ